MTNYKPTAEQVTALIEAAKDFRAALDAIDVKVEFDTNIGDKFQLFCEPDDLRNVLRSVDYSMEHTTMTYDTGLTTEFYRYNVDGVTFSTLDHWRNTSEEQDNDATNGSENEEE